MVDPAYTPNACSPSPRCGYSHGYGNIPVVPNTTTVATATDTLCACARTTGSVAITAAAPQIALPAPISIAVSRRSEEHTSELQSLMRISYAVFCLKTKTDYTISPYTNLHISDQQCQDSIEIQCRPY